MLRANSNFQNSQEKVGLDLKEHVRRDEPRNSEFEGNPGEQRWGLLVLPIVD